VDVGNQSVLARLVPAEQLEQAASQQYIKMAEFYLQRTRK
jgi:hypothetical protein